MGSAWRPPSERRPPFQNRRVALQRGSGTMEVLKRLAPKYWLGYYCVYVAVFAYLTVVFYDTLMTWPEIESLFAAAAIFAVSTGVALLAALITEGVGYVILLIPKRIKELKDEGRAEGREEGRAEGREEGRAEGRAEALAEIRENGRVHGRREDGERGAGEESHPEGIRESRGGGFREGRAEERSLVSSLLACHGRGEITLEQMRAILAEHYNGNGASD